LYAPWSGSNASKSGLSNPFWLLTNLSRCKEAGKRLPISGYRYRGNGTECNDSKTRFHVQQCFRLIDRLLIDVKDGRFRGYLDTRPPLFAEAWSQLSVNDKAFQQIVCFSAISRSFLMPLSFSTFESCVLTGQTCLFDIDLNPLPWCGLLEPQLWSEASPARSRVSGGRWCSPSNYSATTCCVPDFSSSSIREAPTSSMIGSKVLSVIPYWWPHSAPSG